MFSLVDKYAGIIIATHLKPIPTDVMVNLN